MILIFTTLIAFLASPVQNLQAEKKAEEPKALEWKKETHDFGNVTEGTKAKYTFTFVNKGTEPAVITSATASCGCTVPSWPKTPVVPGDSGIIQVKYSAAASGAIDKLVSVFSNATETPMSLSLKGIVVKK